MLVGVAFAALMVGSAGVAQAADYAAIAAGDGGFGWVDGGYSSMESARRAAKSRCRSAGYGSCESSVAERSTWYYSGGNCEGRTYVGTSPAGWWRSDQIVRSKAAADGYGDCYIQVQF